MLGCKWLTEGRKRQNHQVSHSTKGAQIPKSVKSYYVTLRPGRFFFFEARGTGAKGREPDRSFLIVSYTFFPSYPQDLKF